MKVLEIAGIPVDQLAEKVGTPVVVYDEGMLEGRLKAFASSFVSKRFDAEIVYASKAFTCKAMMEKVAAAGCCLDVVSGGEMAIAKEAGMPMERVYFHGNNKTLEELEFCITSKCGNIVLDNMQEAKDLMTVCKAGKHRINAMLRINPLVEAHTHQFIQTAASDSKFGISIEEKESVKELIALLQSSQYVTFRGFHSHIGSQIFGSDAFEKAAEKMIGFMKEMKEYCGYQGTWLSLGGGFGIHYTKADQPIPIEEMCNRLIAKCESMDYPLEKVMIEPGRSVAGEAGISLYRCGYQKLAGDKRYLFVDGGMGDNIRPALYDAEYEADIATKMDSPKDTAYCVAGKYCESGDVLIKNIMLQKAEAGDLLAMYSCGAYGYSMASCYNAIGRPAVVFAKDGKARVVIQRETYKDMLALQKETDVEL